MLADAILSLLTTSGQTITPPQTTRPGISSPQIDLSGEGEKSPLYRVVLLDDDDHTYDYVIEMLQKIFIFTAEQALRHAQEVDAMGRTVLITCELPQAEFARDQVQSYGRDWRLPRSKGSMSAIVEPAGDSA
jgi:ATP-dependent Clp protease adaptor protein ClpS